MPVAAPPPALRNPPKRLGGSIAGPLAELQQQRKGLNVFEVDLPLNPNPNPNPDPNPNPNLDTAPLPPPPPFGARPWAKIVTAGAAVATGQFVMDHHDHSGHAAISGGGMDHGGGGMGHGGMNMGHRCAMNMLWNWDTKGPCIVFRSFYVSGPAALLGYMLLLCVLAAGYECSRVRAARLDRRIRARLVLGSAAARSGNNGGAGGAGRTDSPSPTRAEGRGFRPWGTIKVPRKDQVARSLLYTINLAVSFFLMLVIMTYNAQLIFAVLVGAFLGHFVFHNELSFEQDDGKGLACH